MLNDYVYPVNIVYNEIEIMKNMLFQKNSINNIENLSKNLIKKLDLFITSSRRLRKGILKISNKIDGYKIDDTRFIVNRIDDGYRIDDNRIDDKEEIFYQIYVLVERNNKILEILQNLFNHLELYKDLIIDYINLSKLEEGINILNKYIDIFTKLGDNTVQWGKKILAKFSMDLI